MQYICAHCYCRLDRKRRRAYTLLCHDCELSWIQAMQRRLAARRTSTETQGRG